ncbi:P-loop containing nucleoside triphosphate hydrolase protein [Blyttiomyces helicus]|uniref:Midasin n=1 Tax=Blyttiomyces helicus TaxID=388810 RepID=A0A4V1ISN5_9FUNG|nr:P-loop containing nucleoside triphosphate hydrolase protein [Blyttiomyces helicus]|eukprot:RKO94177.1 P-loop containing nucleoside triphosphate hydrolase protein [Blyttiomyces helicus]
MGSPPLPPAASQPLSPPSRDDSNLTFSRDLGGSLDAIITSKQIAPCLTQSELAFLQTARSLATPPDATASAVLDTLSALLLRPCLTAEVARLFRPLLVDLSARWFISPAREASTHLHACPIHRGGHGTKHTAQIVDASPATSSPKHDVDGNILPSSSASLASTSAQPLDRAEALVAAFSRLLPIAPQIRNYATRAFEEKPSVFDWLSSACAIVGQGSDGKHAELEARIRRTLEGIYRLVRLDPPRFASIWPASSALLHDLVASSPDYVVRICAARILAIQLGMADAETRAFLDRVAARADKEEVRGLELIRLKEEESDTKFQSVLFSSAAEPVEMSGERGAPFVVTSQSLSPLTVDLCGVLIPRSGWDSLEGLSDVATADSDSALVRTLTTKRNLHRIALGLSLGMPLLLEGGPGVGKTALVEEAARAAGLKDLLKIHLGDQTDSKVLLGTYVCTSTPGNFRWQPGVLTTAVTEGRWILIEDIDLAPLEVLSVLTPLLETRHLFIPSRGEKIKAKEGFRIFATRTLFPSRSGGIVHRIGAQSAGVNLWTRIDIPVLPRSEVEEIVAIRFPPLRGLLSEIMAAFDTMATYFAENHGAGRYLSLRDLIKWCWRVSSVRSSSLADAAGSCSGDEDRSLELSVREDLFREAAECFGGMIPDRAIRDAVDERLGVALGVPVHRVQFYAESHVPSIQIAGGSVVVGRSSLPIVRSRTGTAVGLPARPFAATSSSLKLLERLTVCSALLEPVLLVGETGTGKTSVIQYLADTVGTKLVAVNMSQQSDSSDLLGGFKPVDARLLAAPLKDEFDTLFAATFKVKANAAFLDMIIKAYAKKKWSRLAEGFRAAVKMAREVFDRQRRESVAQDGGAAESEGSAAKKTKRTKRALRSELEASWTRFASAVAEFEIQHEQIRSNFLFSFVEGSLVKAIRQGHWVLLDEINLASSETLECLSGLLQGADGSLLLLERGDTVPVTRHPDFRLFACMNPANDAGKRDLPPGLRSRFTEFWVDTPDSTPADLLLIVRTYLRDHLPPGPQGDEICNDVAEFYEGARRAAREGTLSDGADQRLHLSLRTLSRALSHAARTAPTSGLRRAIFEGVCMTFTTGLSRRSAEIMDSLVAHSLRKGFAQRQIPRDPSSDSTDPNAPRYVLVDRFWLPVGPVPIPEDAADRYVLTPSVELNLSNLARAVSSRRHPVLIQGPTSAGKTSIVEYLAALTGHRFVRVNNHEHTDIQEYIGSYVGDGEGTLTFQEGILVEALRKGYWIVLDELNLAPSDVLEALNRLLDDNRELLIPETQEIVRPHPHFMLFATQNPAGQYGGRKALSRAFRNRFLELHFSDIPEAELETILCRRCAIAPSYAKRIVAVYRSLQSSRGRSRIFDGRHGFVTLRDLFRWAGRGADGYQRLAEDGFMLLAERIRREDDRATVKAALEKEMKVMIDEGAMYEREFLLLLDDVALADEALAAAMQGVVWTRAMKRLFVLVAACVTHAEPALLVGDTGCGKTTVCQVLAARLTRTLRIVNAHQHSETADFLGSQRPARGRDTAEMELRAAVAAFLGLGHEEMEAMELDALLDAAEAQASTSSSADAMDVDGSTAPSATDFAHIRALRLRARRLFEWRDGPLVQAMREGDLFLLDEISLADDSVLERLNSVLEPARILTLAEKGGAEVEEIKGADGFRFLATMNPGGDYGKKELSPALRNRFTEIWVPPVEDRRDLDMIVESRLSGTPAEGWGLKMLDFIEWFAGRLRRDRTTIVSLRDILAWVAFMRHVTDLPPAISFVHGGCMVLVDGIGVNPLLGTIVDGVALRIECRKQLRAIACPEDFASAEDPDLEAPHAVLATNSAFGVTPFTIPLGPRTARPVPFAMSAPTTLRNCMRVLRSLQLRKPVLLEGSPGVGKTSLISSLAALSQNSLVRINLSEQTDLADLFGSDLPVEGGKGGQFAWRDGPFLKAMQSGEWILLDELNLASQQVLEGLNACLDHRAEVYVPELDRTFGCHPDFRVFAAQNPQHQGGGRKGLPRSFVNRFTQVYVEALSEADLLFIGGALHPDIPAPTLARMIRFNSRMQEETMERCSFGWRGAPWEFNLRDVVRWIELVKSRAVAGSEEDPAEYLEMVYSLRMRGDEDQEKVRELFKEVRFMAPPGRGVPVEHLQILPSSLAVLEPLVKCVEMGWMALLTGPSASGKTSLIRLLAMLCGERLEEFSMNPGVDAVELLGGFEQADLVRREKAVFDAAGRLVEVVLRELLHREVDDPASASESREIHAAWDLIRLGAHSFDADSCRALVARLDASATRLAIPLKARGVPTPAAVAGLIEAHRTAAEQGLQGTFEWIDGTLIRALEQGHWFLIDNVNLCPAAVLDRLNPLLEPGGVLMVNERGLVDGEVKVIVPHPNFRIFMTMDPKLGEVSRAMRNRAVELHVDSIGVTESDRADLVRILNDVGLPGDRLPESLAKIHDVLGGTAGQERSSSGRKVDARDLVTFTRLAIERAQRGEEWPDAVRRSAEDVYASENARTIAVESVNAMTRWAVPPSGRLQAEESRLAGVSFDGAVLLAAVDRVAVADPLHEVAPGVEVGRVLLAAARIFAETVRARDAELRADWLSHIELSCKHAAATAALGLAGALLMEQCKPGSEIVAVRESLLAAGSIEAEFLDDQPLDLNFNPVIATRLQRLCPDLWTMYSVALGRQSVVRRMAEAQHVLASCTASGRTAKRESLTVMQRAVAFAAGRLPRSRTGHPVVAILAPLFEALDSWVASVGLDSGLDPAELHVILDYRERLWSTVQSRELQHGETAIALRRLGKALSRNQVYGSSSDEATARLAGLVAEASDAAGLRGLEAAGSLWKHGGIATLRSADLAEIETAFRAIDGRLDAWKVKQASDWLMHPSLVVDALTKRTLMEGVATLYYLNESGVDVKSELRDIIRDVPQRIAEKLDRVESEANADQNSISRPSDTADQIASLVAAPTRVPLQLIVRLGSRAARLAMWPILDGANLSREMDILGCLARIVDYGAMGGDPKVELMRLLPELSAYTDVAVEESSLPPLHLEPLQRLIWVCDVDDGRGSSLPGMHLDIMPGRDEPTLSGPSQKRTLIAAPLPLPLVANVGTFVRVILQDALYRWHRALWSNACGVWTELLREDNVATILDGGIASLVAGELAIKEIEGCHGGPSILYGGSNSAFAMQLVRPLSHVPLYAFPGKIEQLRNLQQYLCSARYIGDGAAQSDMLMLISAVTQYVHGHVKFYATDAHSALIKDFSDINVALSTLSSSPSDSAQRSIISSKIDAVLSNLSSADLPVAQTRMATYVDPALRSIKEEVASGHTSLLCRGRSWVLISLAFIRAYVPDAPVDPASAPAIKLAFLEEAAADLRAAVFVRAEMERLMNGNSDNDVVRAGLAELKSFEEQAKRWKSRVALRPSRSQMPEILNDLRQLSSNLISDTAITALQSDLVGGAHSREAAQAKHAFLQDNLASFVDRLEIKYPMYRDILQPIYLALYQLKYGLSLVAEASSTAPDTTGAAIERALAILLRFVDDGADAIPAIQEILPLLKRLVSTASGGWSPEKGRVYLKVALALLRRIYAHLRIQSSIGPESLQAVHALLGELVDAWSSEEKRRIAREKAEEEFYKYKERTHEVETEGEIDEEEFRERFPDFNEAFADVEKKVDDGSADDKPATTPKKRKEDGVIDIEMAQEVRLLHKQIVRCWSTRTPARDSPDAAFEALWRSAFHDSYEAGADLAHVSHQTAHRSLNAQGRGGHVFLASRRLGELAAAATPAPENEDVKEAVAAPTADGGQARYDFYRDPNVAEARRIHPILLAFDSRITELLAQWPDHAILQQLSIISNRIAAFSITSPIMKLLAGIELLLQKCQDWEAYAAREVSLKPLMAEITTCIVRWRKLELRCWRELLDVEDRKSEEKASRLWFHLWKIVVGIAVVEGDDDVAMESEVCFSRAGHDFAEG